MVYKVCYQGTKVRSPKWEEIESLYIEAEGDVDAHQRVEGNILHNIELVQLLERGHLEYEKENADFSLAEF